MQKKKNQKEKVRKNHEKSGIKKNTDNEAKKSDNAEPGSHSHLGRGFPRHRLPQSEHWDATPEPKATGTKLLRYDADEGAPCPLASKTAGTR